jgi:hypothetical protein
VRKSRCRLQHLLGSDLCMIQLCVECVLPHPTLICPSAAYPASIVGGPLVSG